MKIVKSFSYKIYTLPLKLRALTSPSFTTNVLFLTINNIFSLFFSIAVSVIIARFLGPYGKGVLSTLANFMGFASLICSLGLASALQYYIASRKFQIRECIGNFSFFTLFFSLPLFLLILFISQLFKHNILKGVPYNLLLVSGAFTLLGMYFTSIDSTLRALQRFPQSTILGMISSILKLALLLILLALAKLGVWGAMLSDWLVFPVGIVLGFYFLEDVLNISFFKPSFNKEVMGKLLDYSWKVFFSNILWTTALRADVFFVNSFLSPSAVGIYMVAVNYTELLRIVPRAVSGVLFPKVSSSISDDARALTTLMLRSFPLYIIPIAGLLFVIAPCIIPLLFGSSFFSSIGVVAWLLPGIIAWCYWSQLSAYLSGRGYPEYTLYGAAVGAIVTIVGDFLLIPKMGIKGAALVSSLAYGSSFLFLLYFFRLKTNVPLSEIFLPKMVDIKYLLEVITKLRSSKKKDILQ